jgi:GntR family transcriptional regulator/MocR family aminotransferase
LADGESGIQMVGLFGTACDDREVAQAAGRRGVNVSPLSIHYRHGTPRHGLIMGYAAADEALMHRGMCLLRDAVAECQTGSAHR